MLGFWLLASPFVFRFAASLSVSGVRRSRYRSARRRDSFTRRIRDDRIGSPFPFRLSARSRKFRCNNRPSKGARICSPDAGIDSLFECFPYKKSPRLTRGGSLLLLLLPRFVRIRIVYISRTAAFVNRLSGHGFAGFRVETVSAVR